MKKVFFVPTLLAALALPSATFAATIAPSGSVFGATLDQRLDSKSAHDGSTFVLTEKPTLLHHRSELDGLTIDGHLENVTSASATHKATMTLVFDDAKFSNGTMVPIAAKITKLSIVEPHTHHIRDAGLILGGAVAGHMLASKRGVKHGGAAGAAAGFALASGLKSNIVVKRGTLLKLELTQPLDDQPLAASPSP